MNPYLVILPAFNEERSIASVISEIRNFDGNADILVINDGSRDQTKEIAQELGVKLINHPYNLGYGAALQTGFRFAVRKGYQNVVTMDADGQHDPKSISGLFKAMNGTDADVVIGSRFLEGNYRMGFARRIGIVIFSNIARICTGSTFSDPTSGYQLLGFNAFSYLAKEDAYPLDYPDVNIIMLLHKKRFKIVEAPVRMISNPYGTTMHKGMKPFVYIIRMFLAIIMVLLRKEK